MSEIVPVSDIEKRRSAAQTQSGQTYISIAIKRHAVQDLKECSLSRQQIAEGLSQAAGRPITTHQLDAFVSESKSHRFPLDLLAAWVRIAGSRRLLDLVCAESGLYVADETERKLADFGRTVLAREEITIREARLKAVLKERL